MGLDVPPQCRIADCKKPLAKRPWGEYCDNHTCESEDCGEKKGDRENGRYCEEHACSSRLCTKLAVPGEDFCNIHTGEVCAYSSCDNAKEPSEKGKYCTRHTCANDSCYKILLSVDDGDAFCVDHSCHIVSICNREATSVGGFCKEHECKTLGCHTRREEDFTYCANHKCPSKSVNCEEHVLQTNARFCGGHTCESDSDASCFNERVSDYFCDDHTCQVPGCNGGAEHGWTDLCDEHCCNWEFDDDRCEKQRVEEDHCEDHGCVSCSKIVYEDSRVCEEHKCKESECINEKVSDGDNCEEHICKESDCD